MDHQGLVYSRGSANADQRQPEPSQRWTEVLIFPRSVARGLSCTSLSLFLICAMARGSFFQGGRMGSSRALRLSCSGTYLRCPGDTQQVPRGRDGASLSLEHLGQADFGVTSRDLRMGIPGRTCSGSREPGGL